MVCLSPAVLRVPIRGKFPSGNVLYDLFSTNPNEAADKKRMQEFAARENPVLDKIS